VDKEGQTIEFMLSARSIRTRLILRHSALHRRSELCRRTANYGG
jgi:hypothetical protein